MVPRAALIKSGLVSVNTARQVNAAHSKTTAHSTVKRPIHKNTAFKNSNFNQRINTVKDKNVNAARPKAVVNAARPKAVVNVVKGNNVNAVKALACWVWKPKTKVLDHGNPQMDLQDKGVIDSGCSRHMTGNMSYLTDYEEIDGGYVAFGGNPKGGKITGKGSGPNWLFDIDALTKLINYKPVVAGNQSNGNADTKACNDAGDDEKKATEEPRKEGGDSSKDGKSYNKEKEDNVNSTNTVNVACTNEVNVVGVKTSIKLPDDLNMPELEDIVYSDNDEDVGAKADLNNLDAFMPVSPILTTRIHKDHPVEQIIRDLNSAPQTRRMTKNLEEHEPKKVIYALKDTSWIEAMQEELQQIKNKKDERGIVIKNKARLVAQGYTQEEGIDYDEVFAPVARIEAIRLFLAYASFKDFVVYQIDVKSAFLYGKIEEEVYVYQQPRFEDPDFPNIVDKIEKRGKIDKTLFIRGDKGDILLVQVYVDDINFSSTKKSLCIEFEKMMHKKFQISSMGELIFFLGLQVKQKEDGIFISKDKYVTEILKKFGFTVVKTASIPMETQKLLLKDEDGE
ncbi:putative ribonuclease H-like domain-containing protein [Tanacetum coccineum]